MKELLQVLLCLVFCFSGLSRMENSQNLLEQGLQFGLRSFLTTKQIAKSSSSFMTQLSSFSIPLARPFFSLPHSICAIVSFSGTQQDTQTSISTMVGKTNFEKVEILISTGGSIDLITVSYLFIERELFQKQGLYCWSSYQQNLDGSNLRKGSQQIFRDIQKKEYKINSLTGEKIELESKDIKIPQQWVQDIKKVTVFAFLNEFTFLSRVNYAMDMTISGQTGANIIMIKYESSIKLEDLPTFPAYTLLLRREARDKIEPSFIFSNQQIEANQLSDIREFDLKKPVFFGLGGFTVSSACSIFSPLTDLTTQINNLHIGINATSEQAKTTLNSNSFCSKRMILNMMIWNDKEDNDGSKGQKCSLGVANDEKNQKGLAMSGRFLVTCNISQFSTYYNYNGYVFWNDSKSNTQACQPCPPGCLTCTSCSTSSCCYGVTCSTCKTTLGYSLQRVSSQSDWCSSSQYYCSCPNNLFPNTTTGTCQPCSTVIVNCASCNARYYYGTTCGSCAVGYYRVSNKKACAPCLPGCAICDNAGKCKTCSKNLVPSNGVCACPTGQNLFYDPITMSCLSCSLALPQCLSCMANMTVTTCTSCATGYFVSGGVCVQCAPNCVICIPIACTKCQSTFSIVGTTCVCNATLQLFINPTATKCELCSALITNCLTCAVSNSTLLCSVCAPGSFFNGTDCQNCVPLCTNCTSLLNCFSCAATFVPINGSCICNATAGMFLYTPLNKCLLCELLVPQCSVCELLPNATATTCDTCNDGTYSSAGGAICALCPLTCTTCLSTAVCLDCAAGYELNNATDLCDCINCTLCANLTNSSACVDCSGPICVLCAPGYFLSNDTCVQCPLGCATCDDTNCFLCDPPFIPSITPIGSCLCNSALGYFYDTTSQNCSLCIDIYPSCTSCSNLGYSTDCLTCADGTYLLNSTYCQVCPYSCTLCTSGSICSECAPTFTPFNNTCECDAVLQLFLNSSQMCEPCTTLIANCISCSIHVSTLECDTCVNGFFFNASTLVCDGCPNYCVTCLNDTFCDQCDPTFSLINNLCACDNSLDLFQTGSICKPCYSFINYCLDCNISSNVIVCASCVTGTYLAADQFTCISCPNNCDSCDSLGCLNCSKGYTNNGGICECMITCQNFTSADAMCLDCYQIYTLDNVTGNYSTNLECSACSATTYLMDNVSCLACPVTCRTCVDYITCELCQPSFVLINGECVCNSLNNQILSGGICQLCESLIAGCLSCSDVGIIQCDSCYPTWYLDPTLNCTRCSLNCQICENQTACITCLGNYTLQADLTCGSGTCNISTASYFDGLVCLPCSLHCLQCSDGDTCVICDSTFFLDNGKCVCRTGLQYFYSSENNQCNLCNGFTSSNYSNYLGNCSICQYSIANYPLTGIECLTCMTGFFLTNGTCNSCPPGCNKCTSATGCCQCQTPEYVMNFSTCICNNNLNYFENNVTITCDQCNITNCSICATLYQCSICSAGSYLNTSTFECLPEVCGNGLLQGMEQCDDMNAVDGDGCSSYCQIEPFYLCSGLPSTCFLDNRFNLEVSDITSTCNHITYIFRIYPFNPAYAACDFSNFMVGQNQTSLKYVKWNVDQDKVSFHFSLTKNIDGIGMSFSFEPQTLCTSEASSYSPMTIELINKPTNNQKAIFYEGDICDSQKSIEAATKAMEYTSYAVMILSALPCKIVGLELIGVLQLAFFSLGSLDSVNVMMAPMLDMGGINGLTLNLGSESSAARRLQAGSPLTPDRISAIGYSSNFLRNCNAMLLVVFAVILLSFVLFLCTHCCKGCAPSLHKVSKRLIKEVLLTLILFNCFNFAYSVGIHFNYASRADSLYFLGTLAAVATLIIPVLMAVALMATEEDGFGEFKDKLKAGCVERAYFVGTIVYRMAIGLYLSAANEDELSTLIVLGLSLLWLLYNLVNLPFAKAYHNYRACICHLTQFLCLFVAMYYRSMKSTAQPTEAAFIFSPVYLEYSCIFVSLVVSLIVLVYDAYIWLKQCCTKQEQKPNKIKVASDHESQQDIRNNTQEQLEFAKDDVEPIYNDFDEYI